VDQVGESLGNSLKIRDCRQHRQRGRERWGCGIVIDVETDRVVIQDVAAPMRVGLGQSRNALITVDEDEAEQTLQGS